MFVPPPCAQGVMPHGHASSTTISCTCLQNYEKESELPNNSDKSFWITGRNAVLTTIIKTYKFFNNALKN